MKGEEKRHTAYLAVGSNMGDRLANIRKAISLLKDHQISVLKESSIIETDPVGGPPQGKYFNGAVKIRTDLEPNELLKHLKAIESALGREETVRNGPRPIDLDILLYDNISVDTPTLTIPHPRMMERDFVLIPLKEINRKFKTVKG